jgi:hypothetical protein
MREGRYNDRHSSATAEDLAQFSLAGQHATFRNVAGDIAYVANAFLGVRSVDVGDPRKPVLIDTFSALFQNAGR